mmetsp:Transcript_14678/g.16240  ORF Transcript_14678/g.16240 Transcript_14678/m.16240 type:complete len:168 (-) Transcript_14678:205-708(-)
MEAFPDTKVLLTVRDPHRWYKSMKNTLLRLYRYSRTFPTNLIPDFDPRWDPMWFEDVRGRSGPDWGAMGSVIEGEEQAVKFFNEWNEEVRNFVPKERLLVFDVREGWEPLCKFLDLPIPDQPFPNVNDANQMEKFIKSYRRKAWAFAIGVPTLIAGIAYTSWKLLKR